MQTVLCENHFLECRLFGLSELHLALLGSSRPLPGQSWGPDGTQNPAALPLGSQRSRTQTPFSRWRRLAVAEIHGVESPKPGAEIGFSEFCTTPIRNARFLHKWPSGLQAGGGFAPLRAGPVACQGGLKTIKNVKLSQFSASQPQSVRPLSHFRVFQLQDCPRWPQVAQDSPSRPPNPCDPYRIFASSSSKIAQDGLK